MANNGSLNENRAAKRAAGAIKHISGIKPFTIRRRIYSSTPGRLNVNSGKTTNTSTIFTLDVSVLNGTDVLA